MFETQDLSNPECEVSQVDVEVWIDASKGIVVANTIADGVWMLFMNPDNEGKILVYELSDEEIVTKNLCLG